MISKALGARGEILREMAHSGERMWGHIGWAKRLSAATEVVGTFGTVGDGAKARQDATKVGQ